MAGLPYTPRSPQPICTGSRHTLCHAYSSGHMPINHNPNCGHIHLFRTHTQWLQAYKQCMVLLQSSDVGSQAVEPHSSYRCIYFGPMLNTYIAHSGMTGQARALFPTHVVHQHKDHVGRFSSRQGDHRQQQPARNPPRSHGRQA